MPYHLLRAAKSALAKSNLPIAKEFSTEATQLAESLAVSGFIGPEFASFKIELADFQRKLGNTSEAARYLLEARVLIPKHGEFFIRKALYNDLCDAYLALKDYDSAFEAARYYTGDQALLHTPEGRTMAALRVLPAIVRAGQIKVAINMLKKMDETGLPAAMLVVAENIK
jgi:tetratricopeptide (TPR) repeat protein